MKRASIFGMVLLLSSALFAQVRGVPASVTSYGPGRGQAPGVPAGVTSLGPNGYAPGCNQPGCGAGFYPFFPIGSTPATIANPPAKGGHHHNGGNGNHGGGNGNHNGHHHGGSGNSYTGGYVYVPYAIPVEAGPEEPLQQEAETDDPEPPAPTIFERRPVVQPAPMTSDRYGERYLDARERPLQTLEESSEPRHLNLSPVSEEKIPVVIVFKDGHKQEIENGNYAIVGDLLYDLSGPIAKKYKLADLDLAQTVQQNEQRGVDFSLPAAYKPQA